ncbi:MAG: MerR family transcriptional regulator [Bacteroidetes bacterium]|nr:MerR family transcriptional regulator [Bacteroidota bacterium]
MSTTILTLFGEEIVPEEINAVGRGRNSKKGKEKEAKKEEKGKEANPVKSAVTEEKPKRKLTKLEQLKEQAASEDATSNQPQQEEVASQEFYIAPVGKNSTEILEGFKGDKQYYAIGEVAKLFNVKTSHIRFWTNEFAIKVRTTRKGDRLYTPAQIKEIRTIYHLVKERGFTIAGAKTRLKEQKKMTGQVVDLRTSLLRLRNQLVTIKNELA